MKCEVHEDCHEPVVAKVGLPRATALWACTEGFNEFQKNPRCPALVGPGGLRCRFREGHADAPEGWPVGRHRNGTTTW